MRDARIQALPGASSVCAYALPIAPGNTVVPHLHFALSPMDSPILRGFTLLLLLQLAGEAVSRGLSLPIAGPIVGFVLAAIALWAVPLLREPLKAAAGALLPHLSLLFVPAGVGVVLYLKELRQDGLAIIVAILVSTWIGLATTAWVGEKLLPKSPKTTAGAGDTDESRS